MNQRFQLDSGGLAHWLIHHAACRAPQWLGARLEEEWRADLESRRSKLLGLSFALGCCWAGFVIGQEQPQKRAAAWSPPQSGRGSITLADGSFNYFSLRFGTLFLIAGLLAALLCGLIITLAQVRATPTARSLQYHAVNPWSPGNLQ